MNGDKLVRVTGEESLRKYFDSAYMGAYSINPGCEPVVTIAEVLFGKITLDGGRKEEHVVLRFAEKEASGLCEVKPLVLNATNQKTLERLYGKGADALIGKRVQFYIDPAVKAIGGGTTEGVRIRPFTPRPAAAVPPCADCGGEIRPALEKTAEWMASYTAKKYGAPLCADCATRQKLAEAEAGLAEETADEAHE